MNAKVQGDSSPKTSAGCVAQLEERPICDPSDTPSRDPRGGSIVNVAWSMCLLGPCLKGLGLRVLLANLHLTLTVHLVTWFGSCQAAHFLNWFCFLLLCWCTGTNQAAVMRARTGTIEFGCRASGSHCYELRELK